MTYVEAKFGLRIRDSKPSDTGARGQLDPMDVDAVNSLSDGCFTCGGAHFQQDCNAHKGTGKQSYGKGKQSKSCPRVSPHIQAKARVRKTRETPKENPKGTKERTKAPKAYTKVKHRKVSSGLENSKSDVSTDIQESAVTYTTDIS